MNVVEATAAYFRLAPQQITGPRRNAYIVRARFVAARVLRHRFKLSLPMIGRMLARDHSSIHHALEQADALIATDPDYGRATTVLMGMPGLQIPPEIYVSRSEIRAAESALVRARKLRRKLIAKQRLQAERSHKRLGDNASPMAKQITGSRLLAAAMLELAA